MRKEEKGNGNIRATIYLVILITLIPSHRVVAQDSPDAAKDTIDATVESPEESNLDNLDNTDNTDEKFRIGLLFSTHWGRADTIVYDNSKVPDKNNIPYYSMLYWDILSVHSVGVEGKWKYGRKAYMDFSLRAAIPGQKAGQMNDFDWFYSDREWSHWSLHDTTLRWGFTADIFNSWEVLDASPFSIGLGFGYHLDWWAWRDKYVDSIYSTLDKKREKYPKPYAEASSIHSFRDYKSEDSQGKNSMDNAVSMHVLAASVDMSLNWEYAYLRLLGRLGPVFAHGQDHHKLRTERGPNGIVFNDYVFGGPWLEGQMEVGVTIGWFVISIRGEYAFMPPTRGTQHSIYSDGSPDKYAYQGGGLAMNRFTMSTSVAWRM